MKKPVLFFFIFLILFVSETAVSQKTKKIKFSGNVGVNYENYTYSVQNYSTFRPRYPQDLLRLNANANLQIGKYFSIPFGINISNQKVSYNLPSIPDENMIDYVQNPRNNIHIDPTYKWFKAHLGSHTPKYSNLTTGDIQVFGAGVEINPGKFIFAANYGTSQNAIEPDLVNNIQGAYKQRLMGGRIGFGKLKKSFFAINIISIKDEVNSVNTQPIGINPIEGISISPSFQFKLFKHITFSSETAGSIYTENINAVPLNLNEPVINSLSNVININASSHADWAHSSKLEWKNKKLTLGGEVKYIGAGFMPVGYRTSEKDIIDYKLNTKFKLFKKKLSVNGVFGIRNNNISNTKLNTSSRIISSFNLFALISKALSLNVNFSNFGFKNNATNNALRVEMINKSIQITPSYKFKTKIGKHQLTANLSSNNLKQFDVISLAFVDTDSKTVNLSYNLRFKKMPLSLGFNALHLENTSPIMNFNLNNLNLRARYNFKKQKIKPSLQIGFASIQRGTFTKDNRITAKLNVNYQIQKSLRLKLGYALNNNIYGSFRPNATTNENKIKLSLSKKF